MIEAKSAGCASMIGIGGHLTVPPSHARFATDSPLEEDGFEPPVRGRGEKAPISDQRYGPIRRYANVLLPAFAAPAACQPSSVKLARHATGVVGVIRDAVGAGRPSRGEVSQGRDALGPIAGACFPQV